LTYLLRPFAGHTGWRWFSLLPTRSRVPKEPLGFHRETIAGGYQRLLSRRPKRHSSFSQTPPHDPNVPPISLTFGFDPVHHCQCYVNKRTVRKVARMAWGNPDKAMVSNTKGNIKVSHAPTDCFSRKIKIADWVGSCVLIQIPRVLVLNRIP
jgi:hypothetical protein